MISRLVRYYFTSLVLNVFNYKMRRGMFVVDRIKRVFSAWLVQLSGYAFITDFCRSSKLVGSAPAMWSGKVV